MKALVYLGPAKKALEERPKPAITASTDAIVKITVSSAANLIGPPPTIATVFPG